MVPLMHVTFRPALGDDVEKCFRLLPAGFVCEPETRRQLPDVWQQWLQDGVYQMTVLEDRERPMGQRLVGFGSSAFVTNAFAAELREGQLPPSPAAHAVQRHLVGQSPLLSSEAVRRANSGPGLNLLVLHIGWDESVLTPEEVRWVKSKLIEAFYFTHGGYRIKAFLQEVFSEEEMRRGLATGSRLYTDYAEFFSGSVTSPPPASRPFLVGATRDEAQDGSTIAPMFFYTPPRFFFKPWEQELLCLAMLGRSDAEAVAALHVSRSTVQKRWHTIYERTAAAPDLFPPDAVAGQSPQTRGAEKRRHLLAYLRHHPEELRPVLPPKSRP